MSAMAIFRQSGPGCAGVVIALPECPENKEEKCGQGKPPTMDTKPAATECHLMQPHTKSKTAQIEKKSRGLGRFIRQHYD